MKKDTLLEQYLHFELLTTTTILIKKEKEEKSCGLFILVHMCL